MKKILLVLLALALMASVAVAEDGAYIKINDYGEEVIKLHQKLGELGYYQLRAESPWSAKSADALKILQENLDWPITGTVESKEQLDHILGIENVVGKNLLHDYEAFMTAKGFQVESQETEEPTLHCDNREGDTSSFIDLVNWTGLTIYPNTDYTLSFIAKGTGEIRSFLWPEAVKYGATEQGRKTASSDGNIGTQLSDEWQRYVITWRTVSSIDGMKNMLPARVYGGNEVWIKMIKLEAGNKATE